MKKFKYLFLIIPFIMMACHYKKDKLQIKNNSKEEIYYHVILKYRNENVYYSPAIGGKIEPGKYDSPGVRGTIEYEMEKNSYNKILYLVYFKQQDQEYVYKNENTIIFNKKFQVDKYSLEELKSINWQFDYNNKSN